MRDEISGAAAFDVKDSYENDDGTPVDKCADDYIPTPADINAAREIMKQMMQLSMGGDHVVDGKRNKADFISGSLAAGMSATAIRYSAYGGDVIRSLEEAPGSYHTNEVTGEIIGFFSTMNGIIKGMDKAMAGLIELEFLSPRTAEWVCCFVRILYVMLSKMANKDKDSAAAAHKRGVDDFFSGEENPFKIGKKERFIADALDTILGYILGSSAINIDIQFPWDDDLIFGALYEAIAEVLSLLMSMIYSKIDDLLGDFLNDPTNNDIIKQCPAFQYLMNLLLCNINNLLGNIMDLLAALWLKGNEMLKSFDNTFEILILARNVNFFKNIIKLIENLGVRLRQFCDLNEIVGDFDVDAFLNEVQEDLGAPDDTHAFEMNGKTFSGLQNSLTEDEKRLLAEPTYMNIDSPSGPDPDAYINSDLMRKDRGAGPLDINLQTSPLYPQEPVEQEAGDPLDPKSPVADGALDPSAKLEPCGDAFKELLKQMVSPLNTK
jgi:hypothetical protein